MERPTANNYYLALLSPNSISENYQRLIKIFTVNECTQRLIKKLTVYCDHYTVSIAFDHIYLQISR